MRRAVITESGYLDLGDQARRAGYQPGTVVDVLVTSAGTLIVSLSDADHAAIDVPSRPLPPGTIHRSALVNGRRVG